MKKTLSIILLVILTITSMSCITVQDILGGIQTAGEISGQAKTAVDGITAHVEAEHNKPDEE